MGRRRSSLTGGWSGAYRYPRDAGPETVFNARIEEVGGAFTGSMQEPNIFRHQPGPIVSAEIEGIRAGAIVTFIKFYDGSVGMDHAVRYDGQVNDALTRIAGTWTIPGVWSGTFFMTRDDDDDETAATTAAREAVKLRG
ncbi:MAG: hypothetical protein U1E03_06355 [Hyphomonadaceae bacterium]